MTKARIPAPLRRRVIARSGGRCAFCLSAEELMGVTFEVDHITPVSAGGKTALSNLCFCCPTCNRHKAARTSAPDELTGERVPLFHPIRDQWDAHFEWREGATLLFGRTATGRVTIDALRMNRPPMVQLRRYWSATGRHSAEIAEKG
jgi:hypothetical protein